MYEWKPKDLNDPFKMRKGERIIDLEKYIGLLNKNNIYFITEQYGVASGKCGFTTLRAFSPLILRVCGLFRYSKVYVVL